VLWYRNDTTSGGTVSANMADDGTGGDQFANDGIYSATIPGQPLGPSSHSHVQATDTSLASSKFPNDAPARECLVRFGDTFIPGGVPAITGSG